MKISHAEAKPLIDNYIAQIDSAHFNHSGTKIRGYIFTREELFPLVNANQHLFLMWALTPENTNPKHLNLIISGVNATTNGLLDTSNLQITSKPIYKGNLDLGGGYSATNERMDKSRKSLDGGDAPVPELSPMLDEFRLAANNAHLRDSNDEIVKGYHLEPNDINALGLNVPLDGTNNNDEFIFMPLIRLFRLPEHNFTAPFLSIGVSRYDNGQLQGISREYCLPCPTSCPDNYPLS